MDTSTSSIQTRSMVSRITDRIIDMNICTEWNESDPSKRTSLVIRRRLKALKKLEYETIKREVKFYERLQELERQLHEELVPIEKRRCEIINGVVNPDENDCDWSTDESDSEDVLLPTTACEVHGIPNFWLNLLDNKTFLVDPVQEHDRPILKHLQNIKVVCLPKGSRVEFSFSTNEFFTNAVLCKEYHVDLSPSNVRGKKLKYYGPRNVAVFGCSINWQEGMDVTRILYADDAIQCGFKESFFNMFGRSGVLGPDLDEELNCSLEAEFSFCRLLQQTILPRAASIYCNQYYMDNDELDDDEMYNDDDDEDYDPKLE